MIDCITQCDPATLTVDGQRTCGAGDGLEVDRYSRVITVAALPIGLRRVWLTETIVSCVLLLTSPRRRRYTQATMVAQRAGAGLIGQVSAVQRIGEDES